MRRLALSALAMLALSSCGAGSGSVVAGSTPEGRRSVPSCTLPALPKSDLGGPAARSLQGGAARSHFELDHGGLTVTPPSHDARPVLSADQAECAALASIQPNGYPLDSTVAETGVSMGYGLVSVAPKLIAHPEPTDWGQVNDNTDPVLPHPAAYRRRLAWIVVVNSDEITSCGTTTIPTGTPETPPTTPRPKSYFYAVFLIDATTGSDALIYNESEPEPCGASGTIPPSVGVPAEEVSVPWTLVSRAPGGYSGRVAAIAPPCDGVPNPVYVDRDNPAVSVVVLGPVDASCGAPAKATVDLWAATVTSQLPARITHGPLGPYLGPSEW